MSSVRAPTTLATVHRFVRWIRRSGAVLPTPLRPPDRATARQRYRLERMLHDGAVAEISALALELGMIYDTARDEAVAAQVATAQRRVNGILDDLRSVESWIYPPVLASAGLGPGLRAVAERCELRLSLDLPQAELGSQTRARVGLLIADHFHNLPPGSVVRVRVKGRRVIRVSITDQQPGGEARRAHRAVLRCA